LAVYVVPITLGFFQGGKFTHARRITMQSFIEPVLGRQIVIELRRTWFDIQQDTDWYSIRWRHTIQPKASATPIKGLETPLWYLSGGREGGQCIETATFDIMTELKPPQIHLSLNSQLSASYGI
jgi:hypothetical protein